MSLCVVLRFTQDDIKLSSRAFALLADAPCSILRRRGRRENPDSDRSALLRRKPHSDAVRYRRCATALQNVFAVLKLHGDAARGE